MRYGEKNPIIGKTILSIELADDRESLIFHFTDGSHHKVGTYADCCSYTWIEHIEEPALGYPAKVISVDDIELPTHPSFPMRSLLTFCKIVTDRGEIIIDYRNDSNGYYGGSLMW